MDLCMEMLVGIYLYGIWFVSNNEWWINWNHYFHINPHSATIFLCGNSSNFRNARISIWTSSIQMQPNKLTDTPHIRQPPPHPFLDDFRFWYKYFDVIPSGSCPIEINEFICLVSWCVFTQTAQYGLNHKNCRHSGGYAMQHSQWWYIFF